jgi:hypothetical protein
VMTMTRGTRLLYAVVFGVAFWILTWVLAAVAVLQLLLLIFGGQMSAELRDFGARLARYAHDVISFLTGARDELPFPFTDWPGPGAP